ncbi:hypothetical protein DFH09DRAFT_903710, partial [Mycena vulgaris]
ITMPFVVTSVEDLFTTSLPLPSGQVFLDVLSMGKRVMLAIWSCITIIQVRWVPLKVALSDCSVRLWGCSRSKHISRSFRLRHVG